MLLLLMLLLAAGDVSHSQLACRCAPRAINVAAEQHEKNSHARVSLPRVRRRHPPPLGILLGADCFGGLCQKLDGGACQTLPLMFHSGDCHRLRPDDCGRSSGAVPTATLRVM
ncbi:unnamed protein product [Lampetra fluviatilis]